MNSVKAISIVRGIMAGSISLVIYILVVIITTPNLPPSSSLYAALRVNWIIIMGLTLGLGLQVYASSYRKSLGCSIANRRVGIIGSSGGSAISSFFSFFSLVPLGCCGSWLLLLSFLPSIFGSTLSVLLIEYSRPVSYLGLLIVLVYTMVTVIRLKRQLKIIKKVEAKRKWGKGE